MRLVLCDDNRNFCEALAGRRLKRAVTGLWRLPPQPMRASAAVARPRSLMPCLLDFAFTAGEIGLGAARLFRDQYPETAVLVMSGRGDKAT